jgi:hypothetical protein
LGQESNEVARASEGRTSVSSDEAEVRICESALSRAEEERPRLFVTCALVNLFVSRKKLLPAMA